MALIHQDLQTTSASAMVEIYSNRVEISSPDEPLVPVERFINTNQSRNERVADLMRRMHICVEKSIGIDKLVEVAEMLQLPAACNQHCSLKWVMQERMTNQTLRDRFRLPEDTSSTVSQVIAAAIEAEVIKLDEKYSGSRKYARYLPFWA